MEIWHADAAGAYSGVSGNGGIYLRGIQRTNASGVARFETIFPGWYRGRTPHIHMKVFVSGDEVHTGQVFFRPAVHAGTVYGQGSLRLARESTRASGRRLSARWRRGRGYCGPMTIGVQPA